MGKKLTDLCRLFAGGDQDLDVSDLGAIYIVLMIIIGTMVVIVVIAFSTLRAPYGALEKKKIAMAQVEGVDLPVLRSGIVSSLSTSTQDMLDNDAQIESDSALPYGLIICGFIFDETGALLYSSVTSHLDCSTVGASLSASTIWPTIESMVVKTVSPGQKEFSFLRVSLLEDSPTIVDSIANGAFASAKAGLATEGNPTLPSAPPGY